MFLSERVYNVRLSLKDFISYSMSKGIYIIFPNSSFARNIVMAACRADALTPNYAARENRQVLLFVAIITR